MKINIDGAIRVLKANGFECDELKTNPASVPEVTDAQIDRLLSVRVPGGSEARNWFLPHESEKGLENVRQVVRLVLAAAPTPPSTEDRQCKCTLAQSLVGDGCDVCNPKLAAELREEQAAEDRKDAERFREGWTHACNALCMEIALWIERCPHCGMPAPKAPARQEDKP